MFLVVFQFMIYKYIDIMLFDGDLKIEKKYNFVWKKYYLFIEIIFVK